MEEKRQHTAVLTEPEGYERFEQEKLEDGVTITKAFNAEGESVNQAVVFPASTFDAGKVEQWLKDKGVDALRMEWAEEKEPTANPVAAKEEQIADPPAEQVEEVAGECDEHKRKISAAAATVFAMMAKSKPAVTAAQVTAMVIRGRQSDHWKQQSRDDRGRFGSGGGGGRSSSRRGGLSDEAARSSDEFANAASKAAFSGSGSHEAASKLHQSAAKEAYRVASKSQKEFVEAIKRGDALGAQAHQVEMQRATEIASSHEAKSLEHRMQKDVFHRQATSQGYKAPKKRGLLTRAMVGLAKGLGKAAVGTAKLGAKGTAWGAKKAYKAATSGTGSSGPPPLPTRTSTKPPPIPSRSSGPPPLPTRSSAKPPPIPKRSTPTASHGPSDAGIGSTSDWGGFGVNPRAATSSATIRTPSYETPEYGQSSSSFGTPSEETPAARWSYQDPSYSGSTAAPSTPGRGKDRDPRSRKQRKQDAERLLREYATGPLYARQKVRRAILARLRANRPSILAAQVRSGDIIAIAPVAVKAAEAGQRVPRFTIAPAYNGGPLTVEKYALPIIVDLEGLTVNEQSVQAVMFHDDTKLVGHVDTVRNDGRRLELSGVCSGLRSTVDEFVDSAANPGKRFPWKASIEARPLDKPELIPAGATVNVNGQTFEGPIYVARRAELYGVSFVPRGADDKTIVSIAARAARTFYEGEPIMASVRATITFGEWTEAIGVTAEDLEKNEELEGRLKAKYADAMNAIQSQEEEEEEEEPDPVPPEEEEEPMESSFKAQQFNLDAIRATAEQHTDELENICAKYEDGDLDRAKLREIHAKAKQEGRTMKQAAITQRVHANILAAEYKAKRAGLELELVRASRPAGPAIHSSRQNDPGMENDILAAAVMKSGKYELRRGEVNTQTGQPASTVTERLEDIFAEQILDSADKRFRHGIGLQELIIEAAQANGWQGRNFKQESMKALQFAYDPIKAGGFSTVDIAGILSNVMNKFLLQGFFFVEQAWREISAIRAVNDFKQVTSYRLTGADEFKLVPPSGEIKHGTLTEEAYTNKADTYGLLLQVTRTDIINDDLGAITTVPRKLGNGAGKALNQLFWAKFLSQLGTLFTAARANYFEGAETKLQINSLTTAEQMFMDLKDSDGYPIGHMPQILLVPTSLSALSAQLFNSTELRDNTASKAAYPINNPHAGKFRPVVSRYIGNSAFTGNTTTGWGIFADPNEVPTMEMCFLYGNESPTIEQETAVFNMLGIQMRGYMDFGVNTQDHRGGVWSKGEA